MEKKEWIEKLNEIILGNGIIEYPDDQDALQKDLEDFISQELDKAREEGFDSGIEKTVDVIQEGLDELLLEKDGEKYWVGDILRDCGSSVEKMLPQNMKHYLVSKLKDNK